MSLSTPKLSDRLRWGAVWGGVFVCLGVLDIYRMTKHDESTLSETIRWALRTDTPEGETLFLTALGIFARHILR